MEIGSILQSRSTQKIFTSERRRRQSVHNGCTLSIDRCRECQGRSCHIPGTLNWSSSTAWGEGSRGADRLLAMSDKLNNSLMIVLHCLLFCDGSRVGFLVAPPSPKPVGGEVTLSLVKVLKRRQRISSGEELSITPRVFALSHSMSGRR
jgi:hypothetical protein